MRTDSEVQNAIARYRLARPDAFAVRRGGELLGRGVGSSREFQDYREYRPGDDLRHLDWAAYGRSDTPMVRLFREEISPRMQILLDGSRSMAVGSPSKPLVARQIAATIALLAAGLGDVPKIAILDDNRPPIILEPPNIEPLADLPFNGQSTLSDMIREKALPPAKHATRLVISDFLFPHDPEALVGRLAGDASALMLVQVLARSEVDPPLAGGQKLVDAETDEFDDQRLDEETIAAYKQRLTALQRGLADSARRYRARFVWVVADDGLDSVCRDHLCPAEILRPA